METKDIIISLIGLSTLIWTLISFFLLHKQNKDSEVFKKKLDIFHKYIKGEFNSTVDSNSELYSEVGLIGNIKILESIVKLKKYNSENEDSNDNYGKIKSELLYEIRKELNPNISDNIEILKEYTEFLSGKINNNIIINNYQNSNYTIKKFSELFVPHKSFYIQSKDLQEYNNTNNNSWDEYFHYIKIKDINDFGDISLDKKYILNESLKNKISIDIKNKEIFLFSKVGTIGKIGYLEKNKNINIVISDNIFSFQISKEQENNIIPKYILILLKTNYMKSQIQQFIVGSAQPFLSNENINNLLLPIITMEGQEKIIKIFETNNNLAINELNKLITP